MGATESANPSIFDLMAKLMTIPDTIAYLRSEELLFAKMDCVKCNGPMSLIRKTGTKCFDGEVFRCPKCKSEKSIRTGSIFYVSKIC